ncbi:site-2 protease family protein [Sedimenticola selenatireducens]|uniref:Site-2 protease family protein n=1 Tax=Sedimenticola selenatireducens TaxID=191960 RepID=A0A557S7Q7_9GAMM|nr:site-2 protease family protein [Sedimenticola selenatireducens]TVO73452.1 site-2 protease family protein [Sedimenticola selenatireducens]TVT63393.1 MAG: site-2 protease family protein [Sedimenticola selenatireducens]
MEGLTTIQKLAVLFLPVLFAITAHEAAHGWMAKRLGDQTAALLGRVTLNPLKHIDLIGTIILPMAMFALTGFLFGWAKPVPVDGRNLRQPRRDMALVAIAGPGANLIMAICWAGLIHLGIIFGDEYAWFALPMIYMGSAGILINAFLMVLNLIPILPLDGGRVVAALLPPRLAIQYARLEPWGLMIVVALLFTGVLGNIVHPGVGLVQSFSAWIVGLG